VAASDQSLDPSKWASDAGGWLSGTAGPALASAAKDVWGAIKPPSTGNIDQAVADSRALEGQFISQMGQQQATPGVSYGGSAPVVAAPSSAPGAAPIAGPPATPGQPAAVMQQPGMTAPVTMQAQPQQGQPTATQFAAAQPVQGQQPAGMAPLAGRVTDKGGPGGTPQPPAQLPPGIPPGSTPNADGTYTAPVGQMAPEARSGIGHFNPAPDPNYNGVVSGGTYSPVGNYPAAPPDADRMPTGPAPATAPGMMAASMQAAQLNTAPQDQFRQQQMDLAGSLQDTIAGRNTSVAQLQQQQAFAQQQAQQMGLAAAMGRGGNAALAMRTAAGNMGQLGAQQAAASALQRAQETAMAQNQLGAVSGQGRAADIGIAGQNAANIQQGNQVNAANLQAANAANQQSQIGTRGQNIQEQSNRANQVLQANQNQGTAAAGQFNAKTSSAQQYGGLLSAGAGAVSSLLSDERAKTDITTAPSGDFQEFLRKLRPSGYRYIGLESPETGVMAQDVERSRIGRTLVRETPSGAKAIDVPRATGTILAVLADMHRRVTAVEGRKAA
jgi:hypothetical protein